MGLFDKIKNMFIEEVEEDTIKKEVIQVKIPSSKEIEKEKVNTSVEDTEEFQTEEFIRPSMQKKEKNVDIEDYEQIEKNSIPNFFDDSDFEMIEKEPEPTIIKREQKYTKTEILVKPSISGYNGNRKEESKKMFTPTPIISPVYGVLDKNYKKDEITPKKKNDRNSNFDNTNQDLTIDDIRLKAYGTLEEELESNFSNEKSDFLEKEEIDIFSELENDESEDSLIEEVLNKNYDEYEEEINKSYTENLNDSDLFNLIDSMYDKKGDE